MVRPKIQLEKLEGGLSREHYYLNNKSIVSKKVKEMSVLTGSDVFFLGFSPSGTPTLHLGQHSNFVDIMNRFSQVPYGDREKRRLDNLKTMKVCYEKEGYNIDVPNLYDAWKVKKVEEMQHDLEQQKKELADLKLRKSCWENPKDVNSIEKLKEMEESLLKSLQGIRQRKKELQEQQMMESHTLNPIEPHIDPFEYCIPEMFSGNDDLLAYSNILAYDNQPFTPLDQL